MLHDAPARWEDYTVVTKSTAFPLYFCATRLGAIDIICFKSNMLIICQLHLPKSVFGQSLLQCLDANDKFIFFNVSEPVSDLVFQNWKTDWKPYCHCVVWMFVWNFAEWGGKVICEQKKYWYGENGQVYPALGQNYTIIPHESF